jgi:hypothetical protein
VRICSEPAALGGAQTGFEAAACPEALHQGSHGAPDGAQGDADVPTETVPPAGLFNTAPPVWDRRERPQHRAPAPSPSPPSRRGRQPSSSPRTDDGRHPPRRWPAPPRRPWRGPQHDEPPHRPGHRRPGPGRVSRHPGCPRRRTAGGGENGGHGDRLGRRERCVGRDRRRRPVLEPDADPPRHRRADPGCRAADPVLRRRRLQRPLPLRERRLAQPRPQRPEQRPLSEPHPAVQLRPVRHDREGRARRNAHPRQLRHRPHRHPGRPQHTAASQARRPPGGRRLGPLRQRHSPLRRPRLGDRRGDLPQRLARHADRLPVGARRAPRQVTGRLRPQLHRLRPCHEGRASASASSSWPTTPRR